MGGRPRQMSGNLEQVKARLREEALRRRSALSALEVREKSEQIARRAVVLREYEAAHTVMLYMPVRNEVDTRSIINHCYRNGKRVTLPRTLKASHMIIPVELTPDATLVRGEYGILEPPPSATVIAVCEVDFVFVPGVLFSEHGVRLGYGGGYYDRLMSAQEYRAFSCALCFEIQLVKHIPHGQFDRLVDRIVTESRVIDPAKPAVR